MHVDRHPATEHSPGGNGVTFYSERFGYSYVTYYDNPLTESLGAITVRLERKGPNLKGEGTSICVYYDNVDDLDAAINTFTSVIDECVAIRTKLLSRQDVV